MTDRTRNELLRLMAEASDKIGRNARMLIVDCREDIALPDLKEAVCDLYATQHIAHFYGTKEFISLELSREDIERSIERIVASMNYPPKGPET